MRIMCFKQTWWILMQTILRCWHFPSYNAGICYFASDNCTFEAILSNDLVKQASRNWRKHYYPYAPSVSVELRLVRRRKQQNVKQITFPSSYKLLKWKELVKKTEDLLILSNLQRISTFSNFWHFFPLEELVWTGKRNLRSTFFFFMLN